jgi:hypothetical protein
MAQAAVTATNCMLKTEMMLESIAGGSIYSNIVNKDQTFGTANAIEDNSGTSLTQITNVNKARPGDPTCTEVRVDVKYKAPVCGEGTDVDVTFDCTTPAASKVDFLYDTFTFDQHVGAQFTIAADDFDCELESPSEHLLLKMRDEARAMKQRYNAVLSTLAGTSGGSDFTNAIDTAVTPLDLKILGNNAQTGGLVPQPQALTDIDYQYDRMGLANQGYIVISGTRKLQHFIQTGQLFAGNVDGFDASGARVRGNVYQDYQLATAVGGIAPDPILTLARGTFELVNYYTFDAAHRETENGRVTWAPVQFGGEVVRQKVDIGQFVGDGRPFIVDMMIIYSACDNAVTYKWRKDFGYWCIPQTAFCPGDLYNGKLLWNAACGIYTCEDL